MKKRIYSSIFIVLLVAILFILKIYVSNYFFDAFFGILACVACYEMSKLLSKMKRYNFQVLAVVFPAFMLAVNMIGAVYAGQTSNLFWVLYAILIDLALMILVLAITYLITILRKKKTLDEMTVRGVKNTSVFKFAFKKCLNTLIIFVYPAFFFLLFIFINHFAELPLDKLSGLNADMSILILLTAIIIPMFTDTFAMLTGSLIGGKKLCPKLSPNKTISGFVGGILWTVLLTACIYLIFTNIGAYTFLSSTFPIWAYLIIVLFGSVVAVGGDLFESKIKRMAKVSDSGRLIPGHGGLLDRIDSYIYIAPYIMLAFWIFAL